MKLLQTFKNLLHNKINITINIVSDSVAPIMVGTLDELKNSALPMGMPRPRIIEDNRGKTERKSRKLRFVSDTKKEYGKTDERTNYYTEEYKGCRWSFISSSLSFNKDEAMKLHVLLLDNIVIEDVKYKTVLWEDMDPEHTKVWVDLLSGAK